MHFTVRLLLNCSLLIGCVAALQAQPIFKEGVLIYKADTLERLSANPNPMRVVQMKVYKKGDLARQEMILVDPINRSDTVQIVQIRNTNGIYICLGAEKIAVLTTYEEEKLDKANRTASGHLETYKVEKTGQEVQLLGITTERVFLKKTDNTKSLEALVSIDLESPVAVFFEPLSQVKGTPLQFSDQEQDWIIIYTAIAIKPQIVSPQLFDIDPAFMVVNMKQVQEMGKEKN